MLVLSRKEGERLVIGDNITLIVSRISGNRVTVGIEAPMDVKIFRGELHEQAECRQSGVSVSGLSKGSGRSKSMTIDIDCLNALDI